MQPVWVLSVDLQTKTATFQSGLSDAAKSARGAFSDIKSGAGQMGRETSYSMMEARHGVMLLGEEFGVHLPRALTSFIARGRPGARECRGGSSAPARGFPAATKSPDDAPARGARSRSCSNEDSGDGKPEIGSASGRE